MYTGDDSLTFNVSFSLPRNPVTSPTTLAGGDITPKTRISQKSTCSSNDTLRSSQEHSPQGSLRASQDSLRSLRENLGHSSTSLAKSRTFVDDEGSSIGYAVRALLTHWD